MLPSLLRQISTVNHQTCPLSSFSVYRFFYKNLKTGRTSFNNKNNITTDPKAKVIKITYPMSENSKYQATVTDAYQLSKTVKGLKLKVHNKSFSFKPGQWVDFFVPGLDKIAGYSICSSPEYFNETNLIELAVKCSIYPPTMWVHDECKIGSQVDIAVGGQFFFDSAAYLANLTSFPEKDHKNRKGNLLLIAGGVGINPLISMLRHIVRNSSVLENKMNVLLLYCASNEDELIFKDKICDLVSRHSFTSCEFITTTLEPMDECSACISSGISYTKRQRLNENSLKIRIERHFSGDVLDDLTCYLCGPSEMIDSLSGALYKLGLPQDRVFYEKWW